MNFPLFFMFGQASLCDSILVQQQLAIIAKKIATQARDLTFKETSHLSLKSLQQQSLVQ